MSAKVIGPDSEVHLCFALTLENGNVVDSNLGQEPAVLTLGDGNLLPGFERLLLGLQAGAEEVFTVTPEHAFGQMNPTNVQSFKRAEFAGMMIEPGLVVSFADAANNELPGVVSALDDDSVTVDFNHPLAGHTLTFTVHVIDVK
jgi:FKBP-type peptidyl-prolyl cis-trans isomerase SlpA